MNLPTSLGQNLGPEKTTKGLVFFIAHINFSQNFQRNQLVDVNMATAPARENPGTKAVKLLVGLLM